GSVLIFSVNAKPERDIDQRRKKLEQQLRIPHKIPTDINNSIMGGWGTAQVYRRIIFNEIMECLTRTNAGLSAEQKKNYPQLFNFHYKDSAEMLTTGGVIFSESERNRFEACQFASNYEFVKTGADAYHIEVPNLTFRELHHLNKQLPKTGQIASSGIPQEDI